MTGGPADKLEALLKASRAAPTEPYRGLEPMRFADAGILAARDVEVERLVRLVTMYRGVLLYGESGAGKSSVVNAGLLPRLVGEGFWPHRVRVQPRLHEEFALEPIQAVGGDGKAFLPSAFEGAQPDGRLVVAADAFQAVATAATEHGRILLVFDQFEELITLFDDVSPGADAQAVVNTIVKLLRDGAVGVKMLFAFREDYLANLEPLIADQPELADQSLRLGAPPVQYAKEIIRAPFERFVRAFSHELSAELADQIAAELAERSQHRGLNLSELQVVCRRLWNTDDDPATLLKARGVDGLLEDFLNGRLQAFEDADGDIAVVLLTRLVTTSGTRNVVSREDLLANAIEETGADSDVAAETLRRLEGEAHLVRSERRRDVTIYEIVSEFLVPMIARRKEERQAAIELEHFRAEAAKRHQKERAERRRKLLQTGIAVAIAVCLAVGALAIFAWKKKEESDHQSALAKERGSTAISFLLASDANDFLENDPERGLAVAIRAFAEKRTARSTRTLRRATAASLTRIHLQSAKGALSAVAFSPNGHLIAASDMNGTVQIWPADGRRSAAEVLAASGPYKDPYSETFPVGVAFSPDGNLVASAGSDGTVSLWAVRDGHRKRILRGASGPASGLAFSNDGRRIAVGGFDGRVRIWDVRRGDKPFVLPGKHRNHLNGVAFSPDGRSVATAASDNTVRVWDAGDGETIAVLRGHTDILNAVAYSPDGRLLASSALDGKVRLWDVGRRSPVRVLRGGGFGIAFNPDGRLVAVAGLDGTVRIWNVGNGRMALRLRGHEGTAYAVAFTPSGSRVATTDDSGVRVWAVPAGGRSLSAQGAADPTALGWPILAIRARDGTPRIWSLRTRRARTVPGKRMGAITVVAASPDGRFAAATDKRRLYLWALSGRSGRLVQTWNVRNATAISINPQQGLIAAGERHGDLHLWRLDSGRPWGRVNTGHPIKEIAFDRAGSKVAVALAPSMVRSWLLDTGHLSPQVSFESRGGAITSIAFSPKGELLAGAYDDGVVRVWGSANGSRRAVLRSQRSAVRAVAFSPNGRLVASGGNDGVVRVADWAAPVSEPVYVYRTGTAVRDLAFSPSGLQLASAGDSGAHVLSCEVCGSIGRVVKLANERNTRPLTQEEVEALLRAG